MFMFLFICGYFYVVKSPIIIKKMTLPICWPILGKPK